MKFDNLKYFSMFSGIGGFEYGIKEAYNRIASSTRREEGSEDGGVANDRRNPPLCVGYSEIDKHASAIFKAHYPSIKNYGDATKIDPGELPDFDLLVGGFPCQAFSVAGKRQGFMDTRGTLFFDIARILQAKRPRLVLLENVPGLLSHDKGKTFQTILEVLASIGYRTEWQVLNSKDYGVPQSRERIFIVGHLGGEGGFQVFPIGENGSEIEERCKRGAHKGIAATMLARHYSSWKGNFVGTITGGGNSDGKHSDMDAIKVEPPEGKIEVLGTLESGGWEKRHEQIRRVHSPDGLSPTIPTGMGGGVMTKVAIPVLTPDRAEKRQNGRRFKEDGDPAFTLTGQDKHGVEVETGIRRLTPTECERLQGFPDGWTKLGDYGNGDIKEISDTQRYKCLGNAVTTNVITRIMLNVFR